jgi:hypothetical protein
VTKRPTAAQREAQSQRDKQKNQARAALQALANRKEESWFSKHLKGIAIGVIGSVISTLVVLLLSNAGLLESKLQVVGTPFELERGPVRNMEDGAFFVMSAKVNIRNDGRKKGRISRFEFVPFDTFDFAEAEMLNIDQQYIQPHEIRPVKFTVRIKTKGQPQIVGKARLYDDENRPFGAVAFNLYDPKQVKPFSATGPNTVAP